MTEPTPPQPRVAKHLLDPANPRPRPRNDEGLTRVQQWVMSVLVVTTIFHLVVGLILAGIFIDESRPEARIGLIVIAGIFGMGAVAAGFAIHRKNPVTPWLLLGTVPSVIGTFIAFA
jgi:4-hydroxybenzoate polyprenyltransferase